jgi:hypothetical protein
MRMRGMESAAVRTNHVTALLPRLSSKLVRRNSSGYGPTDNFAREQRSRRQARQLLRAHPHAQRVRRSSLLGGPHPIPHDLHDPARTRKKPRQPVNDRQMPTSRIAVLVARIGSDRLQTGTAVLRMRRTDARIG